MLINFYGLVKHGNPRLPVALANEFVIMKCDCRYLMLNELYFYWSFSYIRIISIYLILRISNGSFNFHYLQFMEVFIPNCIYLYFDTKGKLYFQILSEKSTQIELNILHANKSRITS